DKWLPTKELAMDFGNIMEPRFLVSTRCLIYCDTLVWCFSVSYAPLIQPVTVSVSFLLTCCLTCSCGVCGSEEAKYRCPACLYYSCSLQCVKKHKEESGCSGIRNKTTFVPLSHFDEMALLSGEHVSVSFTCKGFCQVFARKMNITLRFLPITFTKSRENSTSFLTKVSDKQTLEEILTHYIHPTESDPVIRQKLKMYVHAPFDHVKVFMKAEGRKANSIRYHELDVHKSLRDNLSYKTLVEYPVLHGLEIKHGVRVHSPSRIKKT
uniref:HIT-type domain-containing protein n=1 Tax=Mola mola TaxID=94237 RepID=A0A3Q3VLI2_MOLML